MLQLANSLQHCNTVFLPTPSSLPLQDRVRKERESWELIWGLKIKTSFMKQGSGEGVYSQYSNQKGSWFTRSVIFNVEKISFILQT